MLIQKTRFQVWDQIEKNAFPSNTIRLAFALENGRILDPDFSAEEENEFIYRGNMYDVVKQELRAGTITFYCVQDEQETNLRALLTSFHVPEKRGLTFDNLLHLIKSLSPDYAIDLYDKILPEISQVKPVSTLSGKFTEFFTARISQPPE